jgi:hypothetical protein
MPSFVVSRAFTANELGVNPITTWDYDRIPAAYVRGAAVSILARGTTTGLRLTLNSGANTIVQRSPVQGGGTAGVTPSPLNTTPITFIAAAGDRVRPTFDEVAGGTPTLDMLIEVEPL